MAQNRPVMHQQQIRNFAQTLHGLLFIDADRLIAQIAAGGNHRKAQSPHQQMMQRRVGQHHAQHRIARRNRRCQRGCRRELLRRTSTIGDSGERSRRSSSGVSSHSRSTSSAAGNISANGFSSRCLRSRRPAHRVLVARVHHQVEAAQSLYADNLALPDRLGGLFQRRFAPRQHRARHAPELELRAALRAGIGLGVESAVCRVAVLARALGAHRELLHRRARPVVGQRLDDGVARSAVGAVGKRIAEAPVARVEDFAQALRAGRDVGHHQRGLLFRPRSCESQNPHSRQDRQSCSPGFG